jgi:L-aspartate oxidase
MIAGAGLNDRRVVEHVVEGAPRAIQRLIDLGVPFATDGDALHLTREGGHSHRRIVHVADATGRAVQQALETAAAKQPNITLIPHMVAIDLVTGRHATEFSTSGHVHGLYGYNRKKKRVETLTGRATVLASGGAGRAYLFSTAPRGATGDGIAMAWRAGCRISNMEFMQFHPTCLYNLDVKNFLITEAVRGEGGLLVNPKTKQRFMPAYDERAELAPRDVVARAIDNEIKRDGLDYVWLDISHREPEFVTEHFPTIHDKLLTLGIDMTKEPIPVVPAQHYTCGGVMVDLRGRTDALGLYAAGEVTQSGLHGANRLASNSLLECLVFGAAAAKDILASWADLPPPPPIRAWDESRVTDSDEEVVIHQIWGEIRRFMWNFVGIVRTTKRVERAKRRIDMIRQEVTEYYKNFRVTPDLIELRNLVEVADLIIRSALSRHESRGLHYILDYPDMLPEPVDTILIP